MTTEEPARSASQRRIIEAATLAFAERGYHGTTTRDIANRAGMSPAAIYVHHRSKEDLLFEISLAGHDATLALVRAAAAEGVTPTERLSAVARAYFRWHAEDHTRARIVNYELHALAPDHLAAIAERRRGTQRVFRSIVEAGLATGEFRTDRVDMTVLAIVSLGIDIGRWYSDRGRWTPEDVAAHFRDLALRLVGAEPA
ncbi:TetR/AcrR family transcriptional regulator [Actinomadura atramentaria]|uniref:TetR/AcrR family transcriptional regulator n=1 Tax=Actinomadura atramentaria TaxID=1990 RepID=UPI000368AF6D|nr:TetR/AcrR family transcriptional regulator [Actinomadura atramentaria]